MFYSMVCTDPCYKGKTELLSDVLQVRNNKWLGEIYM